MIVTKNSFVAYSVLPGTFAMQASYLVISMYANFAYPDVYQNPAINMDGKQFNM